jgi:O-antigen/teichoic acid export membrane protein
MLRRFLRDSAIYGTANILSRGITIALVPLYTRALSPTDYGVIDLVMIAASLANVTVALEISQGFGRYFADAESEDARRAYASTTLWFTVGAYAAFLVAGFAARPHAHAWLVGSSGGGTPVGEEVVTVGLLMVFAMGLFLFAQVQLRWDLKPVSAAVSSLTVTVVSLVLTVLLVLVWRLGLMGVLYAGLAGNASGAILGLWLARQRLALRFSWTRGREMLGYSLPLVPSSVGVFVSLFIDRIAIQQLMTLADVGVYGIGFRIVSVSTLVMFAFQSALTPLVFRQHAEPGTPGEIARIFRLFTAAALAFCFALALFAREILAVFTTPAYFEAARVIPLLAPAGLIAGMYVFSPGLALAKRTTTIAAMNLGAAALNTALNFALIPIMGIVGAATATLVSATALFAAYVVLGERHYPLPVRWRGILVAVAATVALYLVGSLLPAPSLLGTALKGVLLVAALGVFAGVGLVERGEVERAVVALMARWPTRRR